MKHKFILALYAASLTAFPALSQEVPNYKSDVNFEASLPIVKGTSTSAVQQTTSLNGGVLAGYRFFFGTHNGVEVTYGYSRSTQTFNLGGGPLALGSNSDEVFAAYVFRFPHKRWVTVFACRCGRAAL